MEFKAWPKTPRLFRDVVVTEKIDGTNACIIFEECPTPCQTDGFHVYNDTGDKLYIVGAQSRNRMITPTEWSGDKSSDNYDFAKWVYGNADDLFSLLGPGRHYGEWWGKGIARNYGLSFRKFSLFNTGKWDTLRAERGLGNVRLIGDSALGGVPVLYEGRLSERAIAECMYDLQTLGSMAAPGFRNPEGICVYHTQSKQVYKVTLDHNDKGKWEIGAE